MICEIFDKCAHVFEGGNAKSTISSQVFLSTTFTVCKLLYQL